MTSKELKIADLRDKWRFLGSQIAGMRSPGFLCGAEAIKRVHDMESARARIAAEIDKLEQEIASDLIRAYA